MTQSCRKHQFLGVPCRHRRSRERKEREQNEEVPVGFTALQVTAAHAAAGVLVRVLRRTAANRTGRKAPPSRRVRDIRRIRTTVRPVIDLGVGPRRTTVERPVTTVPKPAPTTVRTFRVGSRGRRRLQFFRTGVRFGSRDDLDTQA